MFLGIMLLGAGGRNFNVKALATGVSWSNDVSKLQSGQLGRLTWKEQRPSTFGLNEGGVNSLVQIVFTCIFAFRTGGL